MNAAPITGECSTFPNFTLAALVTDLLFKQFLICTAVQQVEHSFKDVYY